MRAGERVMIFPARNQARGTERNDGKELEATAGSASNKNGPFIVKSKAQSKV